MVSFQCVCFICSLQSEFYPPPPPLVPVGHIPAVRLKSEIPERRMDPPACVQNAMMTKDKKPFTYTPGGIDLSEIRSPRMARRIERNANYEGVTEVPKSPHHNNNIQNLPPSTLAAMNPQIQVQVLPSMPPPPPPLPPTGGPIPPPPPMQPMPTQKINNINNNNNGNQFAERPDMTKIIPDNPMAMLKKTGGPKQRSAFVDEMYATGSMKTPPVGPQKMPEFRPHPTTPPVIERAPPTPVLEQPKPGISMGSLYIPPISQQQPQQQQYQQPQQYQPQQNRVMSPPTPPERYESPKVQSPGTPTLKEAPKPWQNRQPQQHQEVPAWARRDEVSSPHQNGQAISPQPQFQRDQAPASPIHIEVRSKQVPVQHQPRQPPTPDPQPHPNAVYVSQPMVLQHPGPHYGPPQHFQHPQYPPNVNQGGGGTRIIPIMVEGNQSPTADRFQRQQSWGNNPSQSNSFKIIQKITQTDDNNEQNGTVTEHPARYPQMYQQPEGQENQETDPRYRGAAIPSRAFRMLQNMNDTGVQPPVQQPQQRAAIGQQRSQPQVRTIPIQIEGTEPAEKYVHPSEQVAPEPKKYMGSSIPSRSFKMLQAMTAPDVCANANVNVENVTTPTNERWTYDHYMPQSYTPVPFYPDYYYYPMPEQSPEQPNNPETAQKPNYSPYWYYYPPSNNGTETEQQNYDHFLPYCDPYYYYYYYGYYPEMYQQSYPMYNSDTDDVNGYSSTDEMLYYSKQFNKPPTLPQNDRNENKDCKHVPGTESERTDDTDTMIEDNTDDDDEEGDETETEESNKKKLGSGSLQSFASVTDIKVYESEEQDEESEDDRSETTTIEKEEESHGKVEEEEEDEEEEEVEDDVESLYDPMPHQLSVIMEETERSSSICADDETITDLSEDESEEDEISLTVSLKLPSLRQSEKSGESDDEEEDENEVHATFTITSIASPKKEASPNESEEEDSPVMKEKTPEIEKTAPEVVQSETVLEIKPVAHKTEQQTKDEETSDSEESSDENEENWWTIQPVQTEKETTYQRFNKSPPIEPKKQCSTDSLTSSSSKSIGSTCEKPANQSKEVELMSIKDRIKALRESIEAKEKQIKEKRAKPVPIKIEVKTEEPPPIIQEIAAREEPQPSEEEEEDDSGVTSDVKSDCEEFQELQKFNKYQRAATHSRLFQLLQEGVSDDEEEIEEPPKQEDKFSKLSVRQKQSNPAPNRQHLSLPLQNINEPTKTTETTPEISDKLVNELIASLLHSKKGQIFRNMPKDKLKCTALRVLQEDVDDQETPSSSGYNSLLSPPRGSTECSSPAQTPQDFYENTSYSDYYDSWDQQQQQSDHNADTDDHLIPSKAFKIIQEQMSNSKTTKTKSLPKCPRVLSGKNVKKTDSPTQSSRSPPIEVVEVTSAS